MFDPMQTIIETHALERLKGFYFYYLDHKQWEDWASLFVEDAELIVEGVTLADSDRVHYQGMKTILPYVRERLDYAHTVHQGHTPLIDFDSETEARGIWSMYDIIDAGSERLLRGYGHYHERYRKIDGVWKFCSVRLTRLRVEMGSVYLPGSATTP